MTASWHRAADFGDAANPSVVSGSADFPGAAKSEMPRQSRRIPARPRSPKTPHPSGYRRRGDATARVAGCPTLSRGEAGAALDVSCETRQAPAYFFSRPLMPVFSRAFYGVTKLGPAKMPIPRANFQLSWGKLTITYPGRDARI